MEISPSAKISFNTSQALFLFTLTCFAGTKRFIQYFPNSTSKGILFSGCVGAGCLTLSEVLHFDREPYFSLSLRRIVAFAIGSSIVAPFVSKICSKQLTLSLKDGCKFGLYATLLNALFFTIYPRSIDPTYAEENLLRRDTEKISSNRPPIENSEEAEALPPIIIKSNLSGTYLIILSLLSIVEESIETEGLYRLSYSTKGLDEKYQAIKFGKLKDPRTDPEIKNSPHLACCLVKRMIREVLDSEKIPFELFSDFRFKTIEERKLVAYSFLNSLNLDCRSFLKKVFDHLRKIADKAHLNKMDIESLARIFSPNLFPEVPGLDPLKQQELKQLVLEHLIRNDFEFSYED